MRLKVNTFVETTYELKDKDIPDDDFDNWSDDEKASYFEEFGKVIVKDVGYCGYPDTPVVTIEE